MTETGWPQRVALAIYDHLVDREGVAAIEAALIGQAALAEIKADSSLAELFVVRILDSEGEPHAVATRRPDIGLPLFRFNVATMGRLARQAVVASFPEGQT